MATLSCEEMVRISESKEVLSFEDFIRVKNNFRLHFVGKPGGHLVGDIYRQQDAYKKCMETAPRSFGVLVRELRSRIDTETQDYLKKLYHAYLLMHPHAEKDWDMFV